LWCSIAGNEAQEIMYQRPTNTFNVKYAAILFVWQNNFTSYCDTVGICFGW